MAIGFKTDDLLAGSSVCVSSVCDSRGSFQSRGPHQIRTAQTSGSARRRTDGSSGTVWMVTTQLLFFEMSDMSHDTEHATAW